jgi:hypothetical protein
VFSDSTLTASSVANESVETPISRSSGVLECRKGDMVREGTGNDCGLDEVDTCIYYGYGASIGVGGDSDIMVMVSEPTTVSAWESLVLVRLKCRVRSNEALDCR